MKRIKKVIGQKCYLSPCIESDAEHFARWFNDWEVSVPLGDEAHSMVSPESEKEHVTSAIKNQSPVFSIFSSEDDVLIGRGLLFAVNEHNRNAMLGVVIGEKAYWGKGIGKEACQLLLDYAFNVMNLNSVMLGAFLSNKRAIGCYESIGFKRIGIRRQVRLIGGIYYDAVLMDMLSSEFESPVLKKTIEASINT